MKYHYESNLIYAHYSCSSFPDGTSTRNCPLSICTAPQTWTTASLSCSGTLQLSVKPSCTTASLSCSGTLQLSVKPSWTTASLSCSGTLQLCKKTKLDYSFSVMLRYVTICTAPQTWTTASLSCSGTLQLSVKQTWTTASLSCSGTLQLCKKTKLDYSFSVMLRYVTIK